MRQGRDCLLQVQRHVMIGVKACCLRQPIRQAHPPGPACLPLTQEFAHQHSADICISVVAPAARDQCTYSLVSVACTTSSARCQSWHSTRASLRSEGIRADMNSANSLSRRDVTRLILDSGDGPRNVEARGTAIWLPAAAKDLSMSTMTGRASGSPEAARSGPVRTAKSSPRMYKLPPTRQRGRACEGAVIVIIGCLLSSHGCPPGGGVGADHPVGGTDAEPKQPCSRLIIRLPQPRPRATWWSGAWAVAAQSLRGTA